jgi:hypothetical protein
MDWSKEERRLVVVGEESEESEERRPRLGADVNGEAWICEESKENNCTHFLRVRRKKEMNK